jgi:hypothetical protein
MASKLAARGETDLWCFELGNARVLTLGYHDNELRVRIKELCMKANGTFGQKEFKGTSLTLTQWRALVSAKEDISEHVNLLKTTKLKNAEAKTWPLGESKFVDTYNFGRYQTTLVDLRYYFTERSQRKPTRYGLALKVKEWEILCSINDLVCERIEKLLEKTFSEKLIRDIVTRYIILRIPQIAHERCHGCQIVHGSQKQHMLGGCLSEWEDVTSLYFDEIYNLIPRELIISVFCEVLVKLKIPADHNTENICKSLDQEAVKEHIRQTVTVGLGEDHFWSEKMEAVMLLRLTTN